jgi:hypothetical protein
MELIYTVGEHDLPESIIKGQDDSVTLSCRDHCSGLCFDLLIAMLKEHPGNEAYFREINGMDAAFNLLVQNDDEGHIRGITYIYTVIVYFKENYNLRR